MRGISSLLVIGILLSPLSAGTPSATEMPYENATEICWLVVPGQPCELRQAGRITVSASACFLEGCYVAAEGTAAAEIETLHSSALLESQLGSPGTGLRPEVCRDSSESETPTFAELHLACAGATDLFVAVVAGACSGDAWVTTILELDLDGVTALGLLGRTEVTQFFNVCRDSSGSPRLVPTA